MNRHEWWDKFRAMNHEDFTMELAVMRDADNPKLYGLLGEASASLDHWKHGRDQLKGFYDEIRDALGVGGANYGDVLERIEELRKVARDYGVESNEAVAELPWSDMKIGFDFLGDPENVWENRHLLPDGWELIKTRFGEGCSHTWAIFRVIGIPSIEEGEEVRKILKRLATYEED